MVKGRLPPAQTNPLAGGTWLRTLRQEGLLVIDVHKPMLDHVLEQSGRGRVVMPEVDAWFLPDTRGVSYRLQHVKTTIAVEHIDPVERTLGYFHNSGHHALRGDDFDGLFQPFAEERTALPPFVEIAKLDRMVAHPPIELARRAAILLTYHVARKECAMIDSGTFPSFMPVTIRCGASSQSSSSQP